MKFKIQILGPKNFSFLPVSSPSKALVSVASNHGGSQPHVDVVVVVVVVVNVVGIVVGGLKRKKY